MDFNELRSRYDLPELVELEKNFGIELEEEDNLIRNIRTKIAEHIEEFAKFIEEKVTPDSGIRSIFECNVFNDKEKEELFSIYKRLMYLVRWSTELDLLLDPSEDAEYIKQTNAKWPELKEEIHKILELVKESWKKENNIKEHIGYMG